MKFEDFDPQQQQILTCNHQHQLVSAGAGSGKTTVMIQKIADLLINNKVSTSDLLVVTFTNLASMEMRERLIKTLQDELKSQTDDNKKAEIQSLLDGVEIGKINFSTNNSAYTEVYQFETVDIKKNSSLKINYVGEGVGKSVSIGDCSITAFVKEI